MREISNNTEEINILLYYTQIMKRIKKLIKSLIILQKKQSNK